MVGQKRPGDWRHTLSNNGSNLKNIEEYSKWDWEGIGNHIPNYIQTVSFGKSMLNGPLIMVS